jgi:hypothetical protein
MEKSQAYDHEKKHNRGAEESGKLEGLSHGKVASLDLPSPDLGRVVLQLDEDYAKQT